jgi:hypothetical protein
MSSKIEGAFPEFEPIDVVLFILKARTRERVCQERPSMDINDAGAKKTAHRCRRRI